MPGPQKPRVLNHSGVYGLAVSGCVPVVQPHGNPAVLEAHSAQLILRDTNIAFGGGCGSAQQLLNVAFERLTSLGQRGVSVCALETAYQLRRNGHEHDRRVPCAQVEQQRHG